MMKIQILYGSETGTAQSICEDIYRYVLCNYDVDCCVAPFDLYDVKSLVSEKLLICVCSTTGDGDPPRNVKRFWRFIFRRDLPANALQNVNIAFLGLGDSSYSKFNFASKKLYRRLLGLGAVSLLDQLYLADEQDEFGIEQETNKFLKEIWARLDSVGNVAKHIEPICLSPYFECSCEPSETVNIDSEADLLAAQKLLGLWAERQTVLCLRCVRNDRVTADSHFQETRMLVLEDADVKEHVQWLPGDTLNVAPRNDDEAIIRFLRLTFAELAESESQEVLAFGRRMRVMVRRRATQDERSNVLWDMLLTALPQSGVSAYFLASFAFDLHRIPVQRFFSQFRQLVLASMRLSRAQVNVERRQTELERLDELGSLRFANDYLDYVTRPRRTILETLEDFPESTRTLRFEQLLELIPLIRARPYSISSDCQPHGTHGPHLQVLYAVVHYRTRLARVRTGLCSSFLGTLRPAASPNTLIGSNDPAATHQECVLGWVERNAAWPTSGNCALLNDPRSACVMVACGTGVAPFRALIDARVSRGIGNNLLVFGCRNSSADNYLDRCGDLARWQVQDSPTTQCQPAQQGKCLVRVLFAFSRQQPDGSKVYVQHKLVEHADLVWSLIGTRVDGPSPQPVSVSYVFVCGGAKTLSDQVRDALKNVCHHAGGLTPEQADQHLATMERERRYVVEVWS